MTLFKNKSEKLNKKTLAILVSLITILVVGTGTTLAYLVVKTNAVNNVFVPTQVSCKVIEESFDGKTKEGVSVKSTSTTGVPAFIRAEIVVTWVDENNNNNILAEKPKLGTDYELSINATADDNGGKWITDGQYYYYTAPIESGAETADLIKSCEVLKPCSEEGYVLSVEILASAIQTTPTKAVEEHWGVNVSEGKLAL